MMRGLLVSCVAVCLALYVAGAAGAKVAAFPKDFMKCKRNDNACLKVAVENALNVMSKGMPKLGILPIDPLRVTRMSIDPGNKGPVSLKLTLKDQDLFGIGSATVKNVVSNMTDETYMLEVDVLIPTFVLRGNYEVDGRVLLLPLRGNGKDNLTLTDLTANLLTLGHVVKRDGKDFVEIDDFRFRFDTTRLYIELENLFGGDKAVSEHMGVFLNENWRDVLNEVQPGIEEALTAVFTDISKRLFSRVPYTSMNL